MTLVPRSNKKAPSNQEVEEGDVIRVYNTGDFGRMKRLWHHHALSYKHVVLLDGDKVDTWDDIRQL